MKMKKITLLLTLICVNILNGMEKETTYEETYGSLPAELKQHILNTALASSNNLLDAIKTIKAFSILHGIHYNNTDLVNLLMKKFPTTVKNVIEFALEQPELYQKIDTILKQHKLAQAIEILKKEKILQNNLKNFTILLHIIQNKHQTYYTNDLAYKFEPDIGQNPTLAGSYMHLGTELLSSTSPTQAINLIERGADINYSRRSLFNEHRTPLISASIKGNADLVTFLLNNGAHHTIEIAFNEVKKALGDVERLKNHFNFKMKEELEAVKIILEQAMENYPSSPNILPVFAK